MIDNILNEMGMGGMAMGGGGMEPEMMASGAFDEEEAVSPGVEDMEDMGEEDDLDDMSVTCSKEELRELLNAVEMGEKSAEEAFEQLCSEGCCMDDDDLPMDDMDDDLPMDDMDDDFPMECMESVSRIASMLTEDPDIIED